MDIYGQLTNEIPLRSQHRLSLYRDLFGVEGIKGAHLNSYFWDSQDRITNNDRLGLEAPGSEQEIKEVGSLFI